MQAPKKKPIFNHSGHSTWEEVAQPPKNYKFQRIFIVISINWVHKNSTTREIQKSLVFRMFQWTQLSLKTAATSKVLFYQNSRTSTPRSKACSKSILILKARQLIIHFSIKEIIRLNTTVLYWRTTVIQNI